RYFPGTHAIGIEVEYAPYDFRFRFVNYQPKAFIICTRLHFDDAGLENRFGSISIAKSSSTVSAPTRSFVASLNLMCKPLVIGFGLSGQNRQRESEVRVTRVKVLKDEVNLDASLLEPPDHLKDFFLYSPDSRNFVDDQVVEGSRL